SAARITDCFSPSARVTAACFSPSARVMAACRSPSACRTSARRLRSAVICFSIVMRTSSGGLMFFTSTRVTFTPHLSVASSKINRSDAGAHVRPTDSARLLEERDDHIQAARRQTVEAAKAFEHHDGRLRHDLNCLQRDDEREDRDEQYEEHE